MFEDEFFTLTPCASHPVPGYLILSAKVPQIALGALEPALAAHLGRLLASTVCAIETAMETNRVYVLSFCESDGPFHMHLFPRTQWVLEAYQREQGDASVPPDGPAIFEWARRCLLPGFIPPEIASKCAEACERIRLLLKPQSHLRSASSVYPQAEPLDRVAEGAV